MYRQQFAVILIIIVYVILVMHVICVGYHTLFIIHTLIKQYTVKLILLIIVRVIDSVRRLLACSYSNLTRICLGKFYVTKQTHLHSIIQYAVDIFIMSQS